MTALASKLQSLRVTWLEVGERTHYLIARCDACAIVVERQVNDVDDDDFVLGSIGRELLAAAGCDHVDRASGSGLRAAIRR